MYYGMTKDISQGEATSNSEKIWPVALVVVEFHLSAGIRVAGRQAVSQ